MTGTTLRGAERQTRNIYPKSEREKQMKQGAGQATKVRKHMIENKREVRRGRGRKQVFRTNGNQGRRKEQIRRVTGMNETTQKTTR